MLVLLLACDGPPQSPPMAEPEPLLPVETLPPPPDPCRHSVLEQRSPAELAQTTGDADCLERVRLWQDSPRLWAASADLDGDEQSEILVLLASPPELTDDSIPCPPQGCSATLIVGDAEAELQLSGSREALTLQLIDIDTTDSQQELLIRQQQEANAASHRIHIFTFLGQQLTETALEASDLGPEGFILSGNGRVGLDASDCAHRRIRWHRLDGAALVRSTEEATLQPDADAFQQPDGSYRCPG